MTCPACGYEHLRPTRQTGMIRLYTCYHCGHVFQTIERLYHPAAAGIAADIALVSGTFRGELRGIMGATE